ncbi:hypothetical protein AAC387_Pa08g2125 [Persea americana]
MKNGLDLIVSLFREKAVKDAGCEFLLCSDFGIGFNARYLQHIRSKVCRSIEAMWLKLLFVAGMCESCADDVTEGLRCLH